MESKQMNPKELYHGWLIELVAEPAGYSFKCWLRENAVGVSDRKTYPTFDSALTAAQQRADLESAGLAIIHFINGIYAYCKLSTDEHLALANSVVEFISSAS